MFNEEQKRRFIEKKKSEVTVNKFYLPSLFNNTAPREQKLDKDCCNWTVNDILSYFRYTDSYAMSTMIVDRCYLSMYCNWCMSELLVEDGQNHWDEITSEMLASCVNTYDLNKAFITREQIDRFLPQLLNPSDKFILEGLFEGLKGKQFKDFITAKKTDIDGNTLHLWNRDVVISDKLRIFALDSADTFVYKAYADRDLNIPLNKKYYDNIIKPSLVKENMTDAGMARWMMDRLNSIADYLGLPNEVTANKVCMSGKLDCIKRIMKEEGDDLETTLRKHKNEIDNQYPIEKLNSVVMFIKKFGWYFEE